MTHPLTDDLCYTVCEDWTPEDDVERDNMRSAADWQLEQVIDWLRNNLNVDYIWADSRPSGIDVEIVITDLKRELRPTQEDS